MTFSYASPHPEVDALLALLLHSLRQTLGEKLRGVYLYGSLVLGDFDLQISDLDLVAVLTEFLTPSEADAIREMHAAIVPQFPAWQNRVEVVYVAQDSLPTFRTLPYPLGVISPGEPFHIIEGNELWLMNWFLIRDAGICLYGEPADTVMPLITRAEFMQRARKDLHEWEKRLTPDMNTADQSYMILTLCRSLYTLAHQGEQPSKHRAAAWAKTILPQWAVLIDRALLARAHFEAAGAMNFAETQAFLQAALAVAGQLP